MTTCIKHAMSKDYMYYDVDIPFFVCDATGSLNISVVDHIICVLKQ